ncbi:IclR family transcriptional regulator [Mycobacterium hodleri]|uniref:IclR family transcriptional regulator n=1 Tax=Mycolicibacterium hodleri TaxID=49897 RepID=A0A544VY77_9MYCO|nr:IclR family transcriptional regulator [Mycolicibacterium hodleri]TQR84922.1 IclR family transcriptional regulator [Mycolicibacterium hodleri]
MSEGSSSRDERAVIAKAVDLLESLAGQRAGLGVSELARRAGISKSTAFRVLGSLERDGLVDRIGTGYQIGGVVRRLARNAVLPNPEIVRDALVPFVADLFVLTGQTVHVAVLDGAQVVYLTKLFGHRQAPTRPCPDDRFPAHGVAIGKALLAYDHASSNDLEAVPLKAFTNCTTTDPAALRAQFMEIRSAGIAFDADEARIGVSAVAVPLRGPDGAVVAALSITHASTDPAAPRYAEHVRNAGAAAAPALRRALTQLSAGESG